MSTSRKTSLTAYEQATTLREATLTTLLASRAIPHSLAAAYTSVLIEDHRALLCEVTASGQRELVSCLQSLDGQWLELNAGADASFWNISQLIPSQSCRFERVTSASLLALIPPTLTLWRAAFFHEELFVGVLLLLTGPEAGEHALCSSGLCAQLQRELWRAWCLTQRERAQRGAYLLLSPDGLTHTTEAGSPWCTQSLQARLSARWSKLKREPLHAQVIDLWEGMEVRATTLHGASLGADPLWLITLVPQAPITRAPLQELTPKQREVALHAAQGLSYEELGQVLGVSPNTAKYHLKQVYARLGVTSRIELGRFLSF